MLILTEKPSVAKDFARALDCSYKNGAYCNNQYTIINCAGHLFALEEPAFYGTDFPVIPSLFRYKTIPDKSSQAKLVIKTLKEHKTDEILIATDADREGEIIARECLFISGITDTSRIKRFWVSQALTKDVVQNGITNAKPLIEYDLLSAQGFARQKADWLVGMNFSRYISSAAQLKLPVGRVQTALLSVIEQRCNSIQKFISTKYYEHFAYFKEASRDASTIKGIYFELLDNKPVTQFKDALRAESLQFFKNKPVNLLEQKTETKSSNPPQLYNLNAIQKDAFKLYGYSAADTLRIIQSLYEDLKCVSYPRTPSRVMGSENVELCFQKAKDLSDNYTQYRSQFEQMIIKLENKRCFDDAKLEAHHALIPLAPLPQSATEQQQNIYDLILDRFFIAFLPCERYEARTYILDVEGNRFKVIGKKILDKGWKKFEAENKRHVPPVEEKEEDQILSDVDWSNVQIADIETKEKWTKPPAYFNEASILSFMENPKSEEETKKLIGIGTPATRHTFIPKLLKIGYIEVQKKNFLITKLGSMFLQTIRSCSLKNLADIATTTEWEAKLNDNPDQFVQEIKDYVKEAVMENISPNIEKQTSGIRCPLCQREVRRGKFGWYCTGKYDNESPCSFGLFESYAGAKLSDKDVNLLTAGKLTGTKHCTSKSGKDFSCKFSLDADNKIKFVFEEKK